MALGDLAAGQAASDVNFLARVTAEMLSAADNILAELTATQDHLIRVAFARRVKLAPQNYAAQMAVSVAMQAGPQTATSLAAVTDAQINTAVAALWNNMAASVLT